MMIMMMTECKMVSLILLFSCFLLSYAMSDFRMTTLNLNGARDVRKRASLFQLLKLKRSSVIFLQETHSDVSNESDWKTEWDGEVVLSHLSNNTAGVALLFSREFLPLSFTVEEVMRGRLLVVRACFDQYNVVFINVYAPIQDQKGLHF